MKKLNWVVLLLFLVGSNSYADFQNFTKADGLGSNYVTDIAVDINQDVWIAMTTLDTGDPGGVARFNGLEWTLYTIADGLVGSQVYALAIDENGIKWFATSAGVSKFDGINWTTYTTDDGLAHNSVKDIAIDGYGNKWFATSKGVSTFDDTDWKTYTISDGLVNNEVRSITIADNGDIWFGTLGGASRFDGVNWISYTTQNSGLVHDFVYNIGIDGSGNKWFTTGGGVTRFDNTSWTSYTVDTGLPTNSTYDVDFDANGNKWFATSKGLLKFDDSTWSAYTVSDGLLSDTISTVFIADDGTKWVGGYRVGAARYYKMIDVLITPFQSGTIEGLKGGCPRDCGDLFLYDAEVVLTAEARANFDRWEGCDSVDGNQCVINTSASKHVTAYYKTYSPSPLKADINDDGLIDLTDVVLTLQVLGGISPDGVRSDYAASGADVSGDNMIGMEEALFQFQDMLSIVHFTGLTPTTWDQAAPYSFQYDTAEDPCDIKLSCDPAYGAEYHVDSASVSVSQLIAYYVKRGYRQGWLETMLKGSAVNPKIETAAGVESRSCTHPGYLTSLIYSNEISSCEALDAQKIKNLLWNVALGLDSTLILSGSPLIQNPDFAGYASYEEKLQTLLVDRFNFNSALTVSAGLERIDAEKEYIIGAVDRGEPVLMVMWGLKDSAPVARTVLIEGYKNRAEGFFVVINYGYGGRSETNSLYRGDGLFTDNLGYTWESFSIFKNVTPVNY